MIKRKFVFFCAILMIALLLYSFTNPHVSFIIYTSAFAISLIAAVITSIKKRSKNYSNILFTFAVALLIALSLSFISYKKYENNASIYNGKKASLVGTITEITENDNFANITLQLDKIDNQNCTLKVQLSSYYDITGALFVGDKLTLNTKLSSPSDPLYGYSSKSYLDAKGIFLKGTLGSFKVIKKNSNFIYSSIASLKNTLSESLNGLKHAPLAKAVLWGDRSKLDPTLVDNLRKTGVSHTLAVSGLNLTILLASLQILLQKLHVRRSINSFIIIALAIIYMAVTNFSPSIVRAGIMMIIFYSSGFLRRECDSATSLFVAAFIIVIQNRYAVYDVGFMLSFLSTLGILIAGVPFINWVLESKMLVKLNNRFFLSRTLYRILVYLITSFAITVSAVFFTLPITMQLYNEMSLMVIFTNLVILMIFEPALLMVSIYFVFSLFIGKIALFQFILAFLKVITDFLFMLYIKSASLLACIPFVSSFINYPFNPYIIAFIILMIMLFIAFKVKPKYFLLAPIALILCFVTCIMIYNTTNDSTKLIVFNTYNEKKLIISDAESTVLLEGKTTRHTSKSTLFDCFNDNNIKRINHYIIASYSDGITKEITTIFNEVKCDNLYLPYAVTEEEKVLYHQILLCCNKFSVKLTIIDYSSAKKYGSANISLNCPSDTSYSFKIKLSEHDILYSFNQKTQNSAPITDNTIYDIIIKSGKGEENLNTNLLKSNFYAFDYSAYDVPYMNSFAKTYQSTNSSTRLINLDEINIFMITLDGENSTLSY